MTSITELITRKTDLKRKLYELDHPTGATSHRRCVDPVTERVELEERLEAVERELAAQNPQRADAPARTRLELDEGRKRFRIDDNWHEYRGDNPTFFLKVLLSKEGAWEQGSNLVSSTKTQAHKVLASLPQAIKKIVDRQRGGTGGYRFKPKFFPTAGTLPDKNRMRADTD